MKDFDAVKFQTALNAWCRTYALECSKPFLTQWYNDKRLETAGSTQLIEAPEAAVCFALYSVPGFLDVVAEHFLRTRLWLLPCACLRCGSQVCASLVELSATRLARIPQMLANVWVRRHRAKIGRTRPNAAELLF